MIPIHAVDGRAGIIDAIVEAWHDTPSAIVLDRKASIMDSMTAVATEDGVDQVLLFVVDILNEEATLLVPNDMVKSVAEKSFGVSVSGDTVVLPGVMSTIRTRLFAETRLER